MKTETSYKTYSSGVLGTGITETDTFYNRFVHKDYYSDTPSMEYEQYLMKENVRHEQIVGLMTAVWLKERAVYCYEGYGVRVASVITAGVGNAVDITADEAVPFYSSPVQLICFFVEGTLTDAAFLQLFIAATEAKTKTLSQLGVIDPATKTIATGTSTDSISVAASQQGPLYEYAGSMTALGQAVAKLVKISLEQGLKGKR
ncbi:adenosylcobinamide amidohydrolase [Priestia sp. OVL9]|nr:adenosylcobinamide amidohydrolase [Priestia sp. OVL9]